MDRHNEVRYPVSLNDVEEHGLSNESQDSKVAMHLAGVAISATEFNARSRVPESPILTESVYSE